MTLYAAWKPISKTLIAETPDAVRNRLLSFLLDLRERHPRVEKEGTELRSLSKKEVRVSVVNNIYGGQNILASGEKVSQRVQQDVSPGDLESLMAVLGSGGMPEHLVTELSVALEEDEPERSGGIGPRVAQWLAKVREQATSGTAATLATQALLRFFDLSGG